MIKNKKSLFAKIFACISMCAVLFACVSPYFIFDDKKSVFAADDVQIIYDFQGSNFTSYCYVNNSNEDAFLSPNDYTVLSMDIFLSSNGYGLFATPKVYFERYYLVWNRWDPSITSWVLRKDSIFHNIIGYAYQPNAYSGAYVNFYYMCDADFTCNVNRVSFGSSNNTSFEGVDLVRYNYVKYTDNLGHSFVFLWEVSPTENLPSLMFTERTYYLNNPGSYSDNENYNFGYEAGYNNGYSAGNTAGNSSGYSEGYSAGNSAGYSAGYNDGLNEGSQYTFLNLIGATIDAPIQYFQSLFNFELLGVNLSSFLMGLFTLCVVVTIVKLCLGR